MWLVYWFGFDILAMTISDDSVWDANFCFVKHARAHTRTCTRVWLDVNECVKNNGGCNSKRKCINAPGSMKCDNCPTGWANDGAKGCEGLWCAPSIVLLSFSTSTISVSFCKVGDVVCFCSVNTYTHVCVCVCVCVCI